MVLFMVEGYADVHKQRNKEVCHQYGQPYYGYANLMMVEEIDESYCCLESVMTVCHDMFCFFF